MEVANLELNIELYDLSEWYTGIVINEDGKTLTSSNFTGAGGTLVLPKGINYQAYHIGFLLDKLPYTLTDEDNMDLTFRGGHWFYEDINNLERVFPYELVLQETPTDSLCCLAIELFKQGGLKKENQ